MANASASSVLQNCKKKGAGRDSWLAFPFRLVSSGNSEAKSFYIQTWTTSHKLLRAKQACAGGARGTL